MYVYVIVLMFNQYYKNFNRCRNFNNKLIFFIFANIFMLIKILTGF